MTVLTTILNGSSGKDVRDTLNQLLSTVAALTGSTPLTISGTPGSATQGSAYSFTPTTSGGSGGTKTFSLTGTLPAGLAFSTTTGAITGMPTAVGTTSGLNITVTDGAYTVSRGTFSLVVSAVAATLQALTVSKSTATVGTALSSTISGLTSGSSLALTGAGAAGLSISGAIITGTPTTAGAVNIVETLAGATNSPRTTSGAITVSAAAAIVAPARYAAFMDDFEGSPALLSTRPNWSDLGTGLLNKWSISDGFVYNNNLFQARNTVVLGTQTTDFTATVGYNMTGEKPSGNTDADAWAVSQQNFRFWHKDESNFLSVQLDPTTGGGRISVGGKVGGTDVSQQYFYVTFPASKKGELLVQMQAGILRLRLDGKWVAKGPRNAYPFDIADVTAGFPQANRSGYNGIYGGTYRWAQAQSYAVTPLDVTIDFVNDAVGHDVPGGSVGTADIRGTYTGTPARWIYRVLNYNTLVVVQDWRDITANTANGAAGLPTTTASGAAFAGTISLPDGDLYTVEAGYIGTDGFRHTSYSMGTQCGPLGVYFGQSNADGRRSQSYIPTPAVDRAAARADTISGIPDGMFASNTRPYAFPGSYGLAKQLSAIIGKPAIVDVRGVPAQSLAYLSPGGAGWQVFLDGLAARRGVVEYVLWDQGEADADGAFSPTNYSNYFRNTLLPGLRDATGNPNLKVLICPVGRYASTSQPYASISAAQNDAQRDVLHQQYLDIVAKEPNVSFASSKSGCLHSDPYHYSGAVYAKMGGRDAWSVAKALGYSVHDGMGAKVQRIEWNATTIDVVYDLNGATGLTGPVTLATGTVPTPPMGNAKCGWQFSIDNFTTTLPMTGTPQIIGNRVRYTLASNPGTFPKGRQDYGWSFDDTDTIQGTYSDFENIPVWSQKTPLLAVAPQ